jgi:hypothetical protein
MTYTEFEKLIEKSTAYLQACNDRANRDFGIGDYSRYDCDLTRNEIWWSNTEGPRVRAKLTIVGSWSTSSDTWLWAWANPHLSGVEIGQIDKVRSFGEDEGITKLTERKWEAEEVDGWEMTSVAARLLESQGAYRTPNRSGSLFLLYDNLEFIPEDERLRYLPFKKSEQVDATNSGAHSP